MTGTLPMHLRIITQQGMEVIVYGPPYAFDQDFEERMRSFYAGALAPHAAPLVRARRIPPSISPLHAIRSPTYIRF
jgi:hypothetical protein